MIASLRKFRGCSHLTTAICAQVSLVINYDLPNNRELYIHRIGRSGRFGRKVRGARFSFMRAANVLGVSRFLFAAMQALKNMRLHLFSLFLKRTYCYIRKLSLSVCELFSVKGSWARLVCRWALFGTGGVFWPNSA